MDVSIVIPVYNDREALETCLHALAGQTYSGAGYEIVVVDNGSDQAIAPAAAPYGRVRVVREVTPGSYAARNRGIEEARGAAIAFTDADCIPAPDWLERGVAALRSEANCGLVAGRVDLFPADPDDPTACELYDMIHYMDQQLWVERDHFGATANLFTTRAVLEAVGPFKPALRSSGDWEWGRRVHRAGYRQIYRADVRVRHPARRSLAALCRRERRLIGGHRRRRALGLASDDASDNGGASEDAAASEDVETSGPEARPLEKWAGRLVRMLPPLGDAANLLFRNERLQRHGLKRLQVALIRIIVHYAGRWESIRLHLGGESLR